MAKRKPDRWVSKAVALGIVAELGRCTPAQFGSALSRKRFRLGAPSRVNNILHRLKAQGLIQRSVEKQQLVPYKLRTRSGEVKKVSRSQDFVVWSITDRGQKKLNYFSGEGR